MNLAKTSVLSFIATVIKMLSAIVINKAVAVFIGPAGLALIGQYQNFSQLAMIAAKGAINNGVTKYTSEYGRNDARLPILFSTAAKISISCSCSVAIVLVAFSSWLSAELLKSREFTYIFVILGFTIILFTLNSLLLSILNGLKEIKTFISINILQSIYSLIFTSVLIVTLELDGALIAMVTNQSVVFFVVLYMLRRHELIKLKYFTLPFSNTEGRKLFKYALMAITTALTAPVSHIFIRNYLVENFGWDQAGYWQAIWYISSMYLMVVTTSLSIYYLPRLSEITDKYELRKEVFSGYKLILPLVALLALTVYIIREFIVWLLFSQDFGAVIELFKWQLIGDVIKVSAWILSFVMLAKAMTKIYIVTEITFSVTFVLLSIYFASTYGIVGVTYAYFINYVLYLVTMIIVMKKQLEF
ncbi:O-antigen translocase [Pseudoalteromonas haloplanktis]|uniref:O-antigen translocase n=1 Tax=Pseudoalteromonas haloplanktis TaxID=228 RepID=A0ABU1BHX4_PSEHA|nr:O-antigen translocase [Pseudoalteromonas haloplanktis]MDQ9094046.1 O-antigen translocase [Pseudoalteromonas haloplanktis]